jgi:hypothetical protein
MRKKGRTAFIEPAAGEVVTADRAAHAALKRLGNGINDL